MVRDQNYIKMLCMLFIKNVQVSNCKLEKTGCLLPRLSWFFQWAFCTAAATIVSGAVAERVKSPTYAVFAFLMASFIYPVVVAWTWGGGWLATILDVGYMDFAGSGNSDDSDGAVSCAS
jgi:ammonia channel protein AmtB